MRTGHALFLLSMVLATPCMSESRQRCDAPELSKEEVRQVIEQERADRSDLPDEFPEYRFVLRRKGCHYVYMEHGIPEAPEYNQTFILNRDGVIVDAYVGASVDPDGAIECTEDALTATELAKIVREARAERDDLPPEYPDFRTRVERMRCLYLYFEYALPEVRGKYQVFTIDPFGEILEFSLSEPY